MTKYSDSRSKTVDHSEQLPFWKRPWLKRTALAIVLVVGVYYCWKWYADYSAMARVTALQEKMADANLTSDERRQNFEDMRKAMSQLSSSQREQLFTMDMKRREQEMDRYLSMSKAEKKQYLDKRIDEMVKRSKSTNNTANQKKTANQNNSTQQKQQQVSATNRQNGSSPNGSNRTPEQKDDRRKGMLDKTTPDMRAKMDVFRKDMEQRMKERGVNLPTRPGGR
jgi:hypothetical protein